MSATHTPGPWHVGIGADYKPCVCIDVPPSEGTGFVIAHVNPTPRMSSVRGDADANARLIAAAPELYEALRELRECARIDAGNQEGVPALRMRAAMAAARVALAKAGGAA